MPRSLKICTAAGDSASEIRTLGLDIVNSFAPSRTGSASWADVVKSLIEFFSLSPFLRGEGWGEGATRTGASVECPSPGLLRNPTSPRKKRREVKKSHAAFGSEALV